jgi:hypothetical protein
MRASIRMAEARTNMAFMCAVFLAIGLTLWFQPERYANTPSYANLLDILPQHAWATMYVVVAVVKAAAMWQYMSRVLTVMAYTLGVALVVVWLAAFVVRYLTDDGTTIVNVCSWATYLFLIVRSAIRLDDDKRT